jgi:hypothetical protein
MSGLFLKEKKEGEEEKEEPKEEEKEEEKEKKKEEKEEEKEEDDLFDKPEELWNALIIDDQKKAKEALEEVLDRHPEWINIYMRRMSYDFVERFTPLQYAIAWFCDKEIVQLLLDRGADIKLKDLSYDIIMEKFVSQSEDPYVPSGHMNARQLLKCIKRDATDPVNGENQREFWIEEYGKTYTKKWYEGVKEVLVHASAAARVADTVTQPAKKRRRNSCHN